MTRRQSERLFGERVVRTPEQAFKDLNEIYEKGTPLKLRYGQTQPRLDGAEPYDTPYNLTRRDPKNYRFYPE